jgi:pimeloyl-ACP methyl ester carboxylesterase
MRVEANGIAIEVEEHGNADGEPLLMICGIYQQLTYWPPALIDRFTAAELRVITFDNRDVGLTTWVTDPPPSVDELFADPTTANYSLWDMADDAAGVLDVLGVESTHVLGHSMGGMIAQCFASRYPDRTRSLALWGTSPGDGTGESDPRFLERITSSRPTDFEELVAFDVEGARDLIFHPEVVDDDVLETHVRELIERAPNYDSQHVFAVLATGDRSEHLRRLAVPTVVIHGTGDLAIAPSGGESLARLIPDTELVLLEGMGHCTFAPDTIGILAEAVLTNLARA